MKSFRYFFTTLALLTLALLPLQSVQAQELAAPQWDGGVIVGSNYVLREGETVSGGLVLIGGSVLLESGSTFFGDLVVIGGAVDIQERVEFSGDAVVIGGALTVNTEMRGDIVIIGGPALLQGNAHIRGDLVTIGGPAQREDGARVDGSMVDNPPLPVRPDRPDSPDIGVPVVTPRFNLDFNPIGDVLWLSATSIGYGLLALLIVLFLPQNTRRVSDAIVRQPLMAGGMGLLAYTLFVVVMVSLILFTIPLITAILTVPLILIVLLLLGAAMVFGWIALGTEIGTRLMGLLNADIPLPVSAALGTFLLTLVADAFRFIPCFGWIVPAVLAVLAVGAVTMTRFGTQAAALTAPQDEDGFGEPVG
jgi:hypothetical protein